MDNRAQIASYVHRRVSDYELADDIAAEVFAKAIAAEQAGNGADSHLKGYLFRIAHNLIIDYYRQRDRCKDIGLDDVAPRLLAYAMPDYVDPDDGWLTRAIGWLTDEQAEVVNLRRQGFDFEEIAATMGKTKGATKSLRHRAVERLRQMLADAP